MCTTGIKSSHRASDVEGGNESQGKVDSWCVGRSVDRLDVPKNEETILWNAKEG